MANFAATTASPHENYQTLLCLHAPLDPEVRVAAVALPSRYLAERQRHRHRAPAGAGELDRPTRGGAQTADWVHWYNNLRLRLSIEYMPSIERELRYATGTAQRREVA
jgi:hypothetical protein